MARPIRLDSYVRLYDGGGAPRMADDGTTAPRAWQAAARPHLVGGAGMHDRAP
ncbi:hypothetical protein ABZY03_00250 [Streptomyces klenkii]|uniref:hypothetical protein n=1 Tax=Streptomyces klenkii TaxID=1420899 RepID=UPI0033ACBEEB